MSKTVLKDGGSQVDISPGLTARIKKFIKKGEYKTVVDFVRDAIRRRLEELDRIGPNQ